MKKTIIISERQFKEILEGDFAYLNKQDANNAHTEVSASGKIETEDGTENAEPLTGDEYASNRVSMNFWNGLGKGRGIMVNCEKKKKKNC